MNDNTQTNYGEVANKTSIENAISALEKNGFNVLLVPSLEDAKQEVFSRIPEGSEVFTATSVTLDAAGISDEVNKTDKYVSVRNMYMKLSDQPENAVEMRRIGSGSDYAIGSVHAVTEDGQVVVASATGSQLPNYAYGASNVIWVVGAQKIVKDLNQAFERIETHTFPLEDERAQKAYGIHSSINKILIYRKELNARVTIILVNQAIGY